MNNQKLVVRLKEWEREDCVKELFHKNIQGLFKFVRIYFVCGLGVWWSSYCAFERATWSHILFLLALHRYLYANFTSVWKTSRQICMLRSESSFLINSMLSLALAFSLSRASSTLSLRSASLVFYEISSNRNKFVDFLLAEQISSYHIIVSFFVVFEHMAIRITRITSKRLKYRE